MSILTNILNKNELPTAMVSEIAGATHVGLVRSLNEDSFVYIRRPDRDSVLIGVADGMGGHEFGEIASFLVMRYLLTEWNARSREPFATSVDARDYLAVALRRANDHIFHVNKELSIRWAMGTTVTIGILWENKLVVGHVGDSRCYRLRKGKLTLLTVDQNWKEEMVRNGIMSAEEAGAHPFSNMLTNCVGALRDLRIDFQTFNLAPGDRYLFCTDGLSSLVDHEQILECIQENQSPNNTVRDLVRHALRQGGVDNITAVCLHL